MASRQQQLDALMSLMQAPNETEPHVTGIIYGDSGGGKTVLAVKLAQAIIKINGGRILHLDAVNAWRSLKNHPELLENFDRIPYKGKAQLDLIIDAIREPVGDFGQYKVVILDEMSSMTDKDGDVVLKARAAADKEKDPDVLTQPDMGATTERMRRTVTALLTIENISVIFVAHQREDEDKAKGFKVTRPRFMPKFSGTIREGLDFVVHMSARPLARDGSVQTYERIVQCHPTTTVVAKSRVGGLALKTSPDEFIEGVVWWLQGGIPDSSRDVVVDDKYVDASESDDFGGISVD